MKFHHLAYLVTDTARSIEAFRRFFPNVTVHRRPHLRQGAYITYLSDAADQVTIELVEPFENNKLLAAKLHREKRECLPDHLCFAVDDFATEYARMRQSGWLTLTRAFETFSPNEQAAHFFDPGAGIVEIVGPRLK